MSEETGQHGSRRIRAEIRDVLFEVWDPIGISASELGWPRDEYDCCLEAVCSHLAKGANDGEIEDYLWGEMVGHFELFEPGADRTEQVQSNLRRTVAALRGVRMPEI